MENEKLVEAVNAHSVEIAKLKEQNKNQDKDITGLKDTTKVLHEMNANIKILALQGTTQTEKIENIECKVEKLDQDLTEVKTKNDKIDAQKWRNAVKYIVTAILGAVVALVLKRIGLI